MKFKDFCQQLEEKIKASYEEGVTIDQAEKLAAEFLYAQMVASGELKKAALDMRMRKSGLKALKAAIYLDEVHKSDKKPSDVLLGNIVETNELVTKEESEFQTSEIAYEELERYYNIFREGHIYFRGISKGKFD